MEEELNRLASEMFRTFARFEYALKAVGHHKGDGIAEPNWRTFAESIPDKLKTTKSPLADAVAYIFEHPPKKQVVVGGVLQ